MVGGCIMHAAGSASARHEQCYAAAMIKAVAALTCAVLFTAASANTLVHNINGIQVGADGKLERFDRLLFGDDGKVISVMAPGIVADVEVRHRIDGGGRTMLPGLIDAHGHVMGLGQAALQLDLTGTTSLQEVQQRLRAYAAANPNIPWITGRGWNQEQWPDKRFPTAADLDAVVANRPVWLERVDGHASVGNSAALRAAGVTAQTPSPAGGKIEKDAAGKPTGLFIDAAAELVQRKVPPPTRAQEDEALAKAQELLLSNGLTAAADMGTSVSDWAAMRRAATAGRLDVRIIGYTAGVEPLKLFAKPTEWLHGDRLRVGGVKLYADGALGSRGAWLKRPYADANTVGLRFHSDADLLRMARQACTGGFQLAIHAIGDAANDQVIRTYEQLRPACPDASRWRIEHFQIADPADIPRLARSGIIASMQPVHQTSDRLMAEKRLDPSRLAGAYAWQTVARSGARLAFGSDFPVESPNPFPGLAAAISRQDVEGQPPGGWRPEERVSLAQALAGFTRNAAYAGFAESRFGALEPGNWADFILIDRDPSAIDAQALAGTQVIETWVAGKKVWQRGANGPGERWG
jgi:predicted amidohydrolase YtcJ